MYKIVNQVVPLRLQVYREMKYEPDDMYTAVDDLINMLSDEFRRNVTKKPSTNSIDSTESSANSS